FTGPRFRILERVELSGDRRQNPRRLISSAAGKSGGAGEGRRRGNTKRGLGRDMLREHSLGNTSDYAS
ncbi:unnamed protein product, partial [Linum tenue]